MIPRYIYSSYFAFFDNIWASYAYNLFFLCFKIFSINLLYFIYTFDHIQTKIPQVQLMISGYYEVDKYYIQGLKFLNDIFNIS